MKKAMMFGPKDLRIVDVPERTPGPGEAKANLVVAAFGAHTTGFYQGSLPHEKPQRSWPITMCYSGAAEVAEVGPGVTSLRPGDLVYPNFYKSCGHCDICRADRMAGCRNLPLGAFNMMIGEEYESALQEYLIFPDWRLRPAPKGARAESIATTGSVSVSMHAVDVLQPQPWETVAVIGAGFLGGACVQLCKLKGARVVAVDIREDRLARATQFGADETVLVNGDNDAERIIRACGSPPLKVIEVSGKADGAALAIEVVARCGHIAAIGAASAPINQNTLVSKSCGVTGIGGARKVQETIDLLGHGKVDLTSTITHRFLFSQLKEALELKISDPAAETVMIYFDERRLDAAKRGS